MKKFGEMFVLDDDIYFQNHFHRTKNKFEEGILDTALSFVKTFNVALDGGAHYGAWTLQMSSRFREVISIEGAVNIYECLAQNVKNVENVKILNKAIGNSSGFVTVGPGEKYDNTGCGYVLGEGETELITIDSLQLPDCNFIKLDIEGYELFGLQGAENTIKKYKPVIIFEDKGHGDKFGYSIGETGAYLSSLGMKCVAELPPRRKRDLVYAW